MYRQKHDKRKQLFIKKEYQIKFILKFCFLILIGSLLSMGLLSIFSHGTLTSSFDNSRLVIKSTSIAIMPAVIFTNIITLILISLATIGVVLFISHKIAGPMFRFENDLLEIGQGNLTKRISLREKDQFEEIAKSLNTMTSTLHKKVVSIQTGVERSIQSAIKKDAPKEVIDNLNQLDQAIKAHFKV